MILYGIHYSPWSLRARWALDHHDLSYRYHEYTPMVTTPLLRAKLGDFSGKITVPLLFDDDTVVRDSYDIARRADDLGNAGPLFAAGEEVTRAWSATADEITDAGRAITTFAVANDPAAVRENVPGFIPRAARRFATPLVALGTKYLASKYEFSEADAAQHRARMRPALERIANRLVSHDYLGGEFGFSDIAVACAMQFIRPADGWIRLGEASTAAWTQEELAGEFADVLAWRDRILAEHRPQGTRR